MSIIYNQSTDDLADRTETEGARVDFIVHLPRSRGLPSAPRRVSMRPGDRRDWWQRARTDEGWRSSTLYLRHDGDRISMLIDSDGCDCDGRLSNCILFECALDRLHAGDRRRPDWRFHGETQRDYAAEAAGY